MAASMEYKNLKNSIKTLDKIFKYLPESQNKIKTIPSIFNKMYDENFISDYLSYILNPMENGIGFEPLIRIVKDYNKKSIKILDKLTLAEKNNIEIIREYTFFNGRRIDILIKIEDKLIIAIENKIFTTESEKQTIDYAKSIYNEFPNYEYIFLFLTPKGVDPLSEEFIPVSYRELINKLKMVKFDYRDDIRRKVIFDEFILHVEEYMMSKKSDSITEQTKLYLEYEDTIKKLNQYFRKDSLMIFEEFEGIIRSLFDEEDWIFNIKKDRTWHTVYKKTWDIKGLFIHHEFWISNNNILTVEEFYYFIEVEGRDRDKFLTLFDEEYKKIQNKYLTNDIEHRPENRKHAIASKKLDNYFRPGYKGENRLVEEINKCKFIEGAIERTYDAFLENEARL